MEQEQKILLYELVHLVSCLYPNVRVENRYKSLLNTFSESLSVSDQLLLIDVVESYALLHQHSRLQKKNRPSVYREDVLNGMQLFLPSTKHISIVTSRLHAELLEHYGTQLFTYQDYCLLQGCSHSTAKRNLSPLHTFGLLETVSEKRYGKQKLMRVVEIDLLEITSETGVFEEAFSEWSDFEGYVGGVERRG